MKEIAEWLVNFINGELKIEKKVAAILSFILLIIFSKKIYIFFTTAFIGNITLITIFILLMVMPIFFVFELVILGIIKIKNYLVKCKKEKTELKLIEIKSEKKEKYLEELISFMNQEERKLVKLMFQSACSGTDIDYIQKYKKFDLKSYQNQFVFIDRQILPDVGSLIRTSIIATLFDTGWQFDKMYIVFKNKELVKLLKSKDIMEYEYKASYMNCESYLEELKKKYLH